MTTLIVAAMIAVPTFGLLFVALFLEQRVVRGERRLSFDRCAEDAIRLVRPKSGEWV